MKRPVKRPMPYSDIPMRDRKAVRVLDQIEREVRAFHKELPYIGDDTLSFLEAIKSLRKDCGFAVYGNGPVRPEE